VRRSERLSSQRSASRATPKSASSSRKRKNEEGEGGTNKKIRTPPVVSRKPPAVLQSALYAAERMSHAIWISHAINLVVIGEPFPTVIAFGTFSLNPVDDVVYVWYYDNEGAIQSHGINFVQDLPYFLVLLLCFERFTPRDWGIVSEFKFAAQEADKCLLSFPPTPSLSAVDIVIDQTDKIRDHFGIVGRATQVLHATSQSADPRDVDKSLGNMELVVKVYWPEVSRVGEGDIIDKARQIAQHNDHVNGHLPDLIRSHDFDGYSTKRIRTALGIESQGHRALRAMLFRRLYPVTDLIGERFWKAFWECFRCKCTLTLCFHMLIDLQY
jgi:Fungal protein kinase